MDALKKMLGSKKAIVWAIVVCGSTIAAALGYFSPDAWRETIEWVTAFYLGAQGAADVAAALPAKKK